MSKGDVGSKKIRVEFSLEDMDISDFQDSAIYTQIKDYMREVGKNCNLSKPEDSKQPRCPLEKENAIREAMKYFGMI